MTQPALDFSGAPVPTAKSYSMRLHRGEVELVLHGRAGEPIATLALNRLTATQALNQLIDLRAQLSAKAMK